MPRYYSTRDTTRQRVSFEEALLSGLAPDGGLYVPDAFPELEPNLWQSAKSFPELAVSVLQRWLAEEIDPPTLDTLVQGALDFPVPLVQIGEDLWVLELFHGPTLSFKDVGARTMARLMSHFLAQRGERIIILVATSGDTGSAVADGFAGQDNIEVVLLYPQGKVSAVQERQLIVKRPGVRALAVKGDFDDCQRLVKAAFVDDRLKDVPLSSANSINIGRLLPQSLYYLWAAGQIQIPPPSLRSAPPLIRFTESGDIEDEPWAGGDPREVNFCVPSGNLGNLTAGTFAAQMGLPVHRFIAAHNANDYFPNYLHKLAEPYAFEATKATLSNAMDVGAPSNFERLYSLLADDAIFERIWGSSVTDEITKARMKRTYLETGYLACPHTAVGLEAASRYRSETGDNRPLISLATAHPAKFPEVAEEVLGMTPREETLELLWQQETQVDELEPDLAALREVLLAK